MTWDPDRYDRFRDERSRPFFDLMALCRPRPGMRVLDLGCGTGELTRHLHTTFAAAETVGVDRSPEMLARSADHAAPGLHFEQDDIAARPLGGPWDLIVSNAALQWLPGHIAVFARLRAALAPGGQIAVQMPAAHDHPSQVAAAEVAAEAPFSAALDGYVRSRLVLDPEDYATLLHGLGFTEQTVRLQVYGHLLKSRDEVVEWVRGTLLTDYLGRLPEPMHAPFVDRYREVLATRLPDTRPFFFPFRRLLMWAVA